MPSYSVEIVFEDGRYVADVDAVNSARAYDLALIDARMAHPGVVAYGRVVDKTIKEVEDERNI